MCWLFPGILNYACSENDKYSLLNLYPIILWILGFKYILLLLLLLLIYQIRIAMEWTYTPNYLFRIVHEKIDLL